MAESSQSDAKVTGKKTEGASQNAPDYEVLRAHYVERDELIDELCNKTATLEKDSKELTSYKYVTPYTMPVSSEYRLGGIMTAGIVIGVLAVSFLLFLCVVWNNWYSIGFVMWSFLVLFVTADILFIVYFNQRDRFFEAHESFDREMARKTELESSVASLQTRISEIEEYRMKSLTNDIKKYIEIPLPKGAVIDDNYDDCAELMKDIIEIKEKIAGEQDANKISALNRKLTDKKLELFYIISIEKESSNEDVYEIFQKQLNSARRKKNFDLLRTDSLDFESKYGKYITRLSSRLSSNPITPLLRKLRGINEMDTTDSMGYGFTSVDKLREKVAEMKGVYDEAYSTYMKLDDTVERVNFILEYVRLCAYRNIYLGVEVINFIRNNAGGSFLTTSKDKLQLEAIGANDRMPTNVTIDIGKSNTNSIEVVGKLAFMNIDTFKFSVNNPGIAIGAVAVGAIFDIIDQRSTTIAKLSKSCEEMIENTSKISKRYTSVRVSFLRAVEIIKAIAKANEGFMKIYSQLREKVFENGDVSSVTMMERQQIAMATSEYNKIASSIL